MYVEFFKSNNCSADLTIIVCIVSSKPEVSRVCKAHKIHKLLSRRRNVSMQKIRSTFQGLVSVCPAELYIEDVSIANHIR